MGIRVDVPTLGSTLQTLSYPGIILTEAEYYADARYPWHVHQRASFAVILNGRMTERFGRATHDVGRYDITFKPMETEHANAFGSTGARCIIVELESDWLEMHEPRTRGVLQGTCVRGAAPSELSQRLHGELLRQDVVTPLAVQSICLEMLVAVARASVSVERRRMPAWLLRAREILHDGCTEHISLDTLAMDVGVHPVHLAQVFRRSFGMTIGDYTRRLRIHRGARQLLTTTRSIADIAMDSGFCDQSHFSRVFKLVTGSTPAEYRRSAGAGSALPPLDPVQ